MFNNNLKRNATAIKQTSMASAAVTACSDHKNCYSSYTICTTEYNMGWH